MVKLVHFGLPRVISSDAPSTTGIVVDYLNHLDLDNLKRS